MAIQIVIVDEILPSGCRRIVEDKNFRNLGDEKWFCRNLCAGSSLVSNFV